MSGEELNKIMFHVVVNEYSKVWINYIYDILRDWLSSFFLLFLQMMFGFKKTSVFIVLDLVHFFSFYLCSWVWGIQIIILSRNFLFRIHLRRVWPFFIAFWKKMVLLSFMRPFYFLWLTFLLFRLFEVDCFIFLKILLLNILWPLKYNAFFS